MAEKVKINPKVVREQILDKGMTRAELAQHYGISTAQINKFLEVTNMKDLRPKKVMIEIDLEEDDKENLIKSYSDGIMIDENSDSDSVKNISISLGPIDKKNDENFKC